MELPIVCRFVFFNLKLIVFVCLLDLRFVGYFVPVVFVYLDLVAFVDYLHANLVVLCFGFELLIPIL